MAKGVEKNRAEELLPVIFHEVRRPVSSIKGYASLFITEEIGKSTPRQKQTAEKIVELCNSLSVLINDYLDFSELSIKQSEMERNWVSLKGVVEKVIEIEASEINRRQIKIDLKCPETIPALWCREADMQRALINLIDNAIKFSYNGSSVWIDIYEKNGSVLINIKDEGVGIPPSIMPKIFEPFYHYDASSTQAVQGTGLGLTIVKRIVDAYDGEIWFESKFGKGAECFLKLPVLDSEEALEEFLGVCLNKARLEDRELSLIYIRSGREGAELIRKKIHEAIKNKDRMFCFAKETYECALVLVDTNKRDARAILDQRIRNIPEGAGIKAGLAAYPTDAKSKLILLRKAKSDMQ